MTEHFLILRFFSFFLLDKTRILHYFSVVSNAIPGFLKSSVLGSTLFYAYDSFFEPTKTNIRILSEIPDFIFPFSYNKNIYYNQDKNSEDNAKKDSNYNIKDMAGNSLFVVSISSFLVGGIGGAIHASFFLLWDAISQKVVNVGKIEYFYNYLYFGMKLQFFLYVLCT